MSKTTEVRAIERKLQPRAKAGDRVYVLEGVYGPPQADDGFNATVIRVLDPVARTVEPDDYLLLLAIDGARDVPVPISTRAIWPDAPVRGDSATT